MPNMYGTAQAADSVGAVRWWSSKYEIPKKVLLLDSTRCLTFNSDTKMLTLMDFAIKR